MQVEAVLACQCRVPMERQCLTPTSHPPCDVDYTRYSLLPETRNWKHQHRCGLRDLWPFTRAFFRHLQGWDRGMSSSSLFMRNSRIPIHMLADEITNIISIQYSCILSFRMSTWVTQSKRGTIPKPLITPKNNLHCSGQVYKTNYCFQVCMQHFSANSGLGCCWLSLLLWYFTTDATSIIILLWSTISKLWLLVTFNLWNTPVIQQVCDQSSPSSYIIYRVQWTVHAFCQIIRRTLLWITPYMFQKPWENLRFVKTIVWGHSACSDAREALNWAKEVSLVGWAGDAIASLNGDSWG